jgi:glycosyltransferase involved in cell wall biosynthesis
MYTPDQKPHVAVVCDTLPYPTRSGDNQRVAEMIRILRERGWFVHFILAGFVDQRIRKVCLSHVDFLHTFTGQDWLTRLHNGLRRCVRFIDRVGKRIGLAPAEEIATRWLGKSVAPILDYWSRYPKGLDDFVAQLVARYPCRAVIVEYIWLYPAARKLRPGVLRLLDTHDIQHRRLKEFASRGMAFPLKITREEEARIFNEFDAVIAIQSAEAKDIKKMCPTQTILTVGSMGSYSRECPTSVVSGRVLYVGGFNGANIDGLRRFLTSIWPRISQEYMGAHLHVCGYVYRAFLGKEYDRVKFLGHLEVIESEYAEAAVVINPSWIGTGLKIKSVESLARGKPLVTTHKGVEGLHDDVHKSAIICDDDAAFADDVIHLLRENSARNRLSEAALQFAKTHLHAGAVYEPLLTYLNKHGHPEPPQLYLERHTA